MPPCLRRLRTGHRDVGLLAGFRRRFDALEGEAPVVGLGRALDLDADQALADVLAAQDVLAERVLDQARDRPPQRPGAELLVRALLDQVLAGLGGQLDQQAALLEPRVDLAELQIGVEI